MIYNSFYGINLITVNTTASTKARDHPSRPTIIHFPVSFFGLLQFCFVRAAIALDLCLLAVRFCGDLH